MKNILAELFNLESVLEKIAGYEEYKKLHPKTKKTPSDPMFNPHDEHEKARPKGYHPRAWAHHYNEAKKDKKIGKRKIYDKIIEAESILYRNARLMNLKKPFLNEEAIKGVDAVKHGTLDSSRSVEQAISKFINDGMINHIHDNNLENFFSHI